MARVRMSWDWVGEYPIFVYTTWLDHFKFHVKLVKGAKGNQNDSQYGPWRPPWHEYVITGYASKDEVVSLALNTAKWLLHIEMEG